jgi:Major tropism determinant N-terminal domain
MTVEQVQLRRGTAAQVLAFTGAAGELVADTTNNRAVLHDGATAGGFPHARLNDVGLIEVALKSVNLNTLADTSFTVPLPAGVTTYTINTVQVLKGSIAAIATAKIGLYTAASQGGVAIVSQTALALTSNSSGVAGGAQQFTINNQTTAFYNSATLFLNVGTVQGAASTADFLIVIRPGAS